jgi:hypothetical protein
MDDARKAAAAALLSRIADAHDADVGPHDCPVSTALRAGARSLTAPPHAAATAALREGLRKLAAGSGPPQVASEAYRTHYDTIFGGRQAVPRA